MSWLYRRKEARRAQRDADRLDALVSKHGAHGPGAAAFRRELAAARAVAAAIAPAAEPPDAARVALRAGLAMQHEQRVHTRRNVGRAGFALASMAVAAVVILVLTLSSGSDRPPTTMAQSLQSLDALNQSVHSLEVAVANGDKAVITQRLATAQAAVQEAKTQAADLPAPSRDLALTVANRSSDEIQWLANHGPAQFSGTASSTTASPPTTQHGTGATTTTSPRRSTTTTSSTTSSSTTSTTRPASTTTEGPTTTTQPAPPTTAAPVHATGEPPATTGP